MKRSILNGPLLGIFVLMKNIQIEYKNTEKLKFEGTEFPMKVNKINRF